MSGLGADRDWVWYSGPKPSEEDRAALSLLGFGFTPRPHTLEDGRTAHWFHPCGGAVLRRRRNGGRVSNDKQESVDPAVELARLAASEDIALLLIRQSHFENRRHTQRAHTKAGVVYLSQ